MLNVRIARQAFCAEIDASLLGAVVEPRKLAGATGTVRKAGESGARARAAAVLAHAGVAASLYAARSPAGATVVDVGLQVHARPVAAGLADRAIGHAGPVLPRLSR